jgi:hypothetical protein
LSEDIVDLSWGDCFAQDFYDGSRMKDSFRKIFSFARTDPRIELIQGETLPNTCKSPEQV